MSLQSLTLAVIANHIQNIIDTENADDKLNNLLTHIPPNQVASFFKIFTTVQKLKLQAELTQAFNRIDFEDINNCSNCNMQECLDTDEIKTALIKNMSWEIDQAAKTKFLDGVSFSEEDRCKYFTLRRFFVHTLGDHAIRWPFKTFLIENGLLVRKGYVHGVKLNCTTGETNRHTL